MDKILKDTFNVVACKGLNHRKGGKGLKRPCEKHPSSSDKKKNDKEKSAKK